MMHGMGAEWQADLVTAELGSAEKPSEPAPTSMMGITVPSPTRVAVPRYRYARQSFSIHLRAASRLPEHAALLLLPAASGKLRRYCRYCPMHACRAVRPST